MKNLIKLQIIGVQLLQDARVAIITKLSATNPSPNGVHVVSEGQAKRIAKRAIGVESVPALKALLDISNGSATLIIESEECKQGEAWENKKTGQTGTYDKDWTKYSNHEIELGLSAKMKVAEMIFGHALNNAVTSTSAVVNTPAKVETSQDDAPNV